MAVSDNQKLDYLWKKVGFNASKTDTATNKLASNEDIPSPTLIRGDTIWSQAKSIPYPPPGSSAGVVAVYQTTSRIACVVDGTTVTPKASWKTNITDWIDPQFGSLYLVKVYRAPTSTSNPAAAGGTQIFQGSTNDWFFDYQSGVLNFIGENIPSTITGGSEVIYIYGYAYTGIKGSSDWNSVYSTTQSNSASWGSGGSGNVSIAAIAAVSASWDSVYTSVYNTSGTWDAAYARSTNLANTSGTWDTAYNRSTAVANTSATWDTAYTNLVSNSANYLSGYDLTAIAAASGTWDVAYARSTDLANTSATWDSVYTTVKSNSANYILDGGNTKGADIVIGTDDAFNVVLQVNNSNKLILTSDTLSGNSDKTSFGTGSATGTYSFASGYNTKATGNYSYAQGINNTAAGYASHAQGQANVASGENSHAQGKTTVASGESSYAGGGDTLASGLRSTATGQATSATKTNAYASGKLAFANHNRSWVWQGTNLDGVAAQFTSTRTDQFAIRPAGGFFLSGGMGINTDNNANALTVVGTISTNNHLTSKEWSDAYTNLVNNSANYLSGYDLTAIAAASGTWDSVYTTTKANSATWDTAYTNLVSNSANYLSGYDLTAIAAASATWDTAYVRSTDLANTSATWDTAYARSTDLANTSATWITSIYAHDNFLYLSGGHVTGTLSVSGDLSGSGRFATGNMLLGPNEGGAYFGRIGIRENSWQVVGGTEGVTWTARDSARSWNGIAMSSDGRIQTATVYDGQLHTSTDYGVTWTGRDSARNWIAVAMSSDGRIQTATVFDGQLHTSTDYGVTWTARDSARAWYAVAMSSDGRIQTAAVISGQLHTSTDYGVTWTARDSVRDWSAVAMSSDGRIQTAAVASGQLHTSTDYGVTWTARDSQRSWYAVAMSSDGRIQTATVGFNLLHTSTDYGVTWTARDSGRFWTGIAMSSDGRIQTATVYDGQLHTSYATTYSPNPVTVNDGGSNQWNSNYTTTKNTSATWDTAYARSTNLANTSASWDTAYARSTDLANTSGTWDSVYTTVKSNSANYILDGGNTKGADIIIGTDDAFNVALQVNNSNKLLLTSDTLSGNSLKTSFGSGSATGTHSFAQGTVTIASGQSSHAEGNTTVASGDYSHAQGTVTIASGQSSHAEGNNTVASGDHSHAQGTDSISSGTNSHAQGANAFASGYASRAQGVNAVASGFNSHAEGHETATGGRNAYVTYTAATQTFTFASAVSANFAGVTAGDMLRGEDYDVLGGAWFTITVASRDDDTGSIVATADAIGADSTNGYVIDNSGAYSHAEGGYTTASGIYSHAEGGSTTASGEDSHAEGSYTTVTALGQSSHAEGYYSIAADFACHAEGDSTTASGRTSHAEGANTTASGNYSHAEGASTTASGVYSHAQGTVTIASGTNSHAAGRYAQAAYDRSWIWKGSTATNIISTTRTDQFMVSAAGGVFIPGNMGIGTDNNTNALTVVGTISTNAHRTSQDWNSAYNYTSTFPLLTAMKVTGVALGTTGYVNAFTVPSGRVFIATGLTTVFTGGAFTNAIAGAIRLTRNSVTNTANRIMQDLTIGIASYAANSLLRRSSINDNNAAALAGETVQIVMNPITTTYTATVIIEGVLY